jgi:serine/threonine protein kinase
LILIIGTGVILYKRAKSRKKKTTDQTTLAPIDFNNCRCTSLLTLMKSTTQLSTTTKLSTQDTTLVADQSALYIPGYLEFQDGADFVLERQIAVGGMGTVWLAKVQSERLRQTNNGNITCVVKMSTRKSQSAERQHIQEVSIGNYLNEGRNIAKTLGYVPCPLAILMAYYPLGSLHQLIYTKTPPKQFIWSSRWRALFAFDVASGVDFMHRRLISHSDLKPQNVLLNTNGGRIYAVLTDFGVSTIFNEKSNVVAGFDIRRLNAMSIQYASPEVLTRYRSSHLAQNFGTNDLKASDVYSIGAILYEMICMRQPWSQK